MKKLIYIRNSFVSKNIKILTFSFCMENDNQLIIENYQEFMMDNLAISKYNYFDGENKYYISKKNTQFFLRCIMKY